MALYEELPEVRVVDPTTGGEKGSKLARFSLIPPEFLWALAEHYGKGAAKYTKVLTIVEACATIGNICTCNTQNTVSSVAVSRLGVLPETDGVVPVMNASYVGRIFNTLNANVRIQGLGPLSTEMSNENGLVLPQDENASPSLDLLQKMKLECSVSKEAVPSAEMDQTAVGSILITITKPESSEESYVGPVTKDSDALGTIRTVLQQHKPTCRVQRLKFQPSFVPGEIKLSGDRNWERGYNWSLSVDALERHLNQWKAGEIYDPETGTHHLICVAWHACALFCYSIFGKGTNDVHNRPLAFIQGAEKA